MPDLALLGMEIHADSEDAARLVECLVRRVTGNEDATPDTAPGVFQFMVQAEPGTDVPAFAEEQLHVCADELGIAQPWKLVTVLRP